MDTDESDISSKQIASVKEAISLYGERITRGKQDLRRPQLPYSEKLPSKARELHLVKKDIFRFNESRNVAEQVKSQAESELLNMKKTVKDLTNQIEESKLKANARNTELEALTRVERNRDSHQYEEVMRELKIVKQELSKLKLDMAYLSEMKSKADKETEAANSRIRSYSSNIEALKKDIEEANEEQVLVELARMEAFREYEAIEAEKAVEATKYISAMEEKKKQMEKVAEEIESSKEFEFETKLAITNFDVHILQNELNLIKSPPYDTSVEQPSKVELENVSTLELVKRELEEANNELACIKAEGFQFMSSMDIIRNELRHVSEETAYLKKQEEKADLTVQNLDLKLLRAKSKLEAVTSAEEKAKAIMSSLSDTLQQLTTEAEAGKKERNLIIQESDSIIEETQKTETQIDLAEEKLRVAMQELEAVRISEAVALESLKTLSEQTMKARASASEHNSSITISQFEYNYLNGRAEGVEEIADKKVAAAMAWIEALKASEKEILMKTEAVIKEMREIKVVEEKEYRRKDKSLTVRTNAEGELETFRHQGGKQANEENLQLQVDYPRKFMRDIGNTTSMRKAHPRRNSTHGARHITHSNTVTLKKRAKVMPNLGKLFGNKGTE